MTGSVCRVIHHKTKHDVRSTIFFTPDDLSNIRQAIRAAEMKTSGEIRVHIEEVCPKAPVLDRAAEVLPI